MLTYMSRFLSGDLEPFWPHVTLLSLAVLASIAVGGGIIFERPKYPPSVHRVAFWLVVGGIAIEAVCTIFLFVFDEGISNAQQSKIVALDRQLLQIRFPRSLDTEKFKSGIAEIPSQVFEVFYDRGAADGQNLAFQIFVALHIAGWKTDQKLPAPLTPQVGPPELRDVYPSLSLEEQSGGQDWGVSVVTKDQITLDKKTPADILVSVLSYSVLSPVPTVGFGKDETMPAGKIRIIVGPKLP